MPKIKEMMKKDVLTVHPETPISIVIKILVLRRISGLPVVNDDNNLLGIITEKDLMQLLVNNKDIHKKTASDFMTKNVRSFPPEASSIDVCKFLLEKPFRKVPIVEDEKLVGIVSRADIISLLWKEHFENK